MCNGTKKSKVPFIGEIITAAKGGRYVLGRNVKARTYIADRKKGVLLFDTFNEGSKEYSSFGVLSAIVLGIVGMVYVLVSLKNGKKRKKTVKLQAKEIRRLEKLCRDSGATGE